jgi:hypothetical protein
MYAAMERRKMGILMRKRGCTENLEKGNGNLIMKNDTESSTWQITIKSNHK